VLVILLLVKGLASGFVVVEIEDLEVLEEGELGG
jgi:hypothetical protein